jgi:hypothetical protein
MSGGGQPISWSTGFLAAAKLVQHASLSRASATSAAKHNLDADGVLERACTIKEHLQVADLSRRLSTAGGLDMRQVG